MDLSRLQPTVSRRRSLDCGVGPRSWAPAWTAATWPGSEARRPPRTPGTCRRPGRRGSRPARSWSWIVTPNPSRRWPRAGATPGRRRVDAGSAQRDQRGAGPPDRGPLACRRCWQPAALDLADTHLNLADTAVAAAARRRFGTARPLARPPPLHRSDPCRRGDSAAAGHRG